MQRCADGMVYYRYFFNFFLGNSIMKSLHKLFLCRANVREVSQQVGFNAADLMKTWASKEDLDDYESVQGDYTEALDYINATFIKKHKPRVPDRVTSVGPYPTVQLSDGLNKLHTVGDLRSYDAYTRQEVFRTNGNFRYDNAIKRWHVSGHKRFYDRDEHENGLRDIRELNSHVRGYNMDNIYADNPFESSDSITFKQHAWQ